MNFRNHPLCALDLNNRSIQKPRIDTDCSLTSDVSSSYSSLYKRRQVTTKSTERRWPSRQSPAPDTRKVNVVRCQKDQFTKPSRSKSPSRLSVMISNARQGLSLLENKLNKLQEPLMVSDHIQTHQSTKPTYLKPPERAYQTEQENNPVQKLMQRLVELEGNNRDRDRQIQGLQSMMDKIQLQLDQQQTKRRQKTMMRKMGEFAVSPNATTPRQSSPLRMQDINAYTFNLASPQKCTDLREFIIHTQSYQILKNSQSSDCRD